MTPCLARARSCAAPTKSRKSGAGPRRPRLELRVELAGDEPRVIRQLDDLDQPALLERPGDDEARRRRAAGGSGCSPRSGGGGARGSSPRRRSRRVRVPSAISTACAPRRIVPPRSSTSFCSGSRSITGYGVSGSISVEFAPSSPTTWRANSETATCMPRQMPRYGISLLARDAAGEDLALPAARAEAARDEHAVDLLELALRLLERHALGVDPATLTWQPWWMPACLSASCTDRYASWSFTYLPTRPIVDRPLALPRSARSASAHSPSSARRSGSPSFWQTRSSSPCSWSAAGTR